MKLERELKENKIQRYKKYYKEDSNKDIFSVWIVYNPNEPLSKILSGQVNIKNFWDKVEVVENYIEDLSNDFRGKITGSGTGEEGRDISIDFTDRKKAIDFIKIIKKNLASILSEIKIFSEINDGFISDEKTPDEFIDFMRSKLVNWYSWKSGKFLITGRG